MLTDDSSRREIWQNGRMMDWETLVSGRSGAVRFGIGAALTGVALIVSGCGSTEQIRYEVAHSTITLGDSDLEKHGIGFLTPAAATGREADKQALALSFANELRRSRPDVKVVTLPEILGSVNAQDLDQQYKRMYRDYLETGILEGSVLRRLGEVGAVRYLGQLSLAEFQQGSRGRFNFLGLRLVDTKQAAMRIFLQIWDTETGAVAWEGSAEVSYSYETAAEDPAPFLKAAALAAARLYQELPRPEKS
jgi:hypothetical protein